VNLLVTFPPGTTTVTLTVSDGEFTDSDSVEIIVEDATAPVVTIIVPNSGDAVQDGVTFTAVATDISGVDEVYFYIREANGDAEDPVGYENKPGTFNSDTGF
jgi:hypothetical protein